MFNLFHKKKEANKHFVSVGKKKGFWERRNEKLARQIAKELLKWINLGTDVKAQGSGKVIVIKPYDLELDQKKKLEEEAEKQKLPHPIEK